MHTLALTLNPYDFTKFHANLPGNTHFERLDYSCVTRGVGSSTVVTSSIALEPTIVCFKSV